MSEPDQPEREAQNSEADRTLLGVAPPRIDSSAASPRRSPVLVRSGTSVADEEPAPLPRMAPPSRAAGSSAGSLDASLGPQLTGSGGTGLQAALRYAGERPVFGMLLLPVVLGLSLIGLARHRPSHTPAPATVSHVGAADAPGASQAANTAPKATTLAELEGRPASSLSAQELVLMAEGHAAQKRGAARALREKLQQTPALGKDTDVQNQLLRLAADETTAPEALSAMASLEPPTGADLLYEVWTATSVRTETTELARALLYSPDLRPKASPALAVALDLRVAETCEQYQAVLPRALTEGDRRAHHLLLKLTAKHGCGAKKNEDCYACLRDKSDELKATINAAKSRRPPSFASPD